MMKEWRVKECGMSMNGGRGGGGLNYWVNE